MQTDLNPLLIALPVGGFFVFFPLLWIVVCFILSWTGGWSRLTERYRTRELKGDPHYMEGAIFGGFGFIAGATYRGCLTIRVGPDGLGLSVWPIFRAGHPPLLIPWKDIAFLGEEKRLWVSFGKYRMGNPKITDVLFYKKGVEEKIRAYVTGSGASRLPGT